MKKGYLIGKREIFVDNEAELIAGIDEVGVSSVAGPMVGSVVILPINHGIEKLPYDSKLMSENEITATAKKIKEKALFYETVFIDAKTVDELGVDKAQRRLWNKIANAYLKKAPGELKKRVDWVLIDGRYPVSFLKKATDYRHFGIVKGDASISSISAAAIISKFECDQVMRKLDKVLPAYKFKQNKGYPSKDHRAGILKHGLSEYHRHNMATNWMKNYQEPVLKLSPEELGKLKAQATYLYKNCYDDLSSFEKRFMSFVSNKNSYKQQFTLNKTVEEIKKRISSKKRREMEAYFSEKQNPCVVTKTVSTATTRDSYEMYKLTSTYLVEDPQKLFPPSKTKRAINALQKIVVDQTIKLFRLINTRFSGTKQH